MKLLLTSGGVTNASIRSSLETLLDRPVAQCRALVIPTAQWGHPMCGPTSVQGLVAAGDRSPHLAGLGWASLGVLELTALQRAELLALPRVLVCTGLGQPQPPVRRVDPSASLAVEVRRSADPVRLARLHLTPFTDRLVTKFGLPVTGWRGRVRQPTVSAKALPPPKNGCAETPVAGGGPERGQGR